MPKSHKISQSDGITNFIGIKNHWFAKPVEIVELLKIISWLCKLLQRTLLTITNAIPARVVTHFDFCHQGLAEPLSPSCLEKIFTTARHFVIVSATPLSHQKNNLFFPNFLTISVVGSDL